MAKTIMTAAGEAVQITGALAAVLESPETASKGSLSLFFLKDAPGGGQFVLLWEWGGDWAAFESGAELDAGRLDGWEPAAINDALMDLNYMGMSDTVMEDMEWYQAWADAAEVTIGGKKCAQ